MRTLQGAKITFAKSKLSGLSDGERKVFYTFSHILNRLKLLETQLFGHFNIGLDNKRSPIEREAATFGALETVLLLAAELKEAWEAFQNCYYKTAVSATMNQQLSQEAQQLIKRLGRHFEGDGVISKLRNNFAYHHSPDLILEAANAAKDSTAHTLYLFEGENNYFGYATEIRIDAIAKILGLNRREAVIEVLVMKVGKEVFAEISEGMTAILAKLLESVEHGREDVQLRVPSESEVDSGYFLCMNNSPQAA